MKIIDDVTFENGVIITTFESVDTSKPHCEEYCVMDGVYCKFCGKGFEDSDEDESKTQFGGYLDRFEASKKELDKWM